MAYSRWSNSVWYTFWSSTINDTKYRWPTKKLKNSQTFEICDFPSYHFTYGELQDIGIYPMLKKIKKFYSVEHKQSLLTKWNKNNDHEYEEITVEAKNPSEEQMIELLGYIREWEKDVEDHFRFLTFIKYEWWYPLRNKFLKK